MAVGSAWQKPAQRGNAGPDFRRIKRLPPCVFNIVNEWKAEARARGEDITEFRMSDPDRPTPQHIVDKLIEAAAGKSLIRDRPRILEAEQAQNIVSETTVASPRFPPDP